MLSAQCSTALNQRETAAIGRAREKSGIEFPIVCMPRARPHAQQTLQALDALEPKTDTVRPKKEFNAMAEAEAYLEERRARDKKDAEAPAADPIKGRVALDHIVTSAERLAQARELRKTDRHADALALAQEVVRNEPTNADAWWLIGLAAHSLMQLPVALQALRETIKHAPRFADGFAQYGVVLAENGQRAEGLRALQQALRISPEYEFALRQAARIAGEEKDEDARIDFLQRLDALGKVNARDLNTLGIAHWNRKHFSGAIECYRRSAAMEGGAAPHFNLGLVFSHAEVSQEVDAVDAYRRALEVQPGFEPAERQLRGIAPRLAALADKATKAGDTLLSGDEWFQFYLNPFELLRAEPWQELEEFDPKTLQRRKKELLQEISLEDGRLSWLDGKVVDQSRAIGLCGELNDETKRGFHWHVFQNERLLRFLTRGEQRHFLYDPEYSPLETLDALDEEWSGFREWLSKPFARQYSLVLSRAFERHAVPVVEILFDGRRWVLPEDDDLCFDAALRYSARLLEPLRVAAKAAEKTVPTVAEIEHVLSRESFLDIFNLLPPQFRAVQGDAVSLVRDIAIACNNKHEDSDLSKAVLQISKKFVFKSAELTQQLEEDFKKVEELIREQRKHEAKLTSGDVAWEVTKDGVRQGVSFISTRSVSTMRWGILVTGYQHAPVYEYLMAFRDDARHEVVFSWKSSKDLEKQQEHFNQLVQAALSYIAPTIMEKVKTRLEQGQELKIGTCTLRHDGVLFSTQGWIFSNTHLVPWRQVGTNLEHGQLVVYDQATPRTRTVMPLRETENAIVLQFLSGDRA